MRFWTGVFCCAAAILAAPNAVLAQSFVFRGQLVDPAPASVRVVIRFGGQMVSCTYNRQGSQADSLCRATISSEYATARVEIGAEGYDTWTKNAFLDHEVVDLGQIRLQPTKPKDLVVVATRLRIRASRDFLIETVAENLSRRDVPIRSLVLEGAHPWRVQCRESAVPNAWQPLTFDWQLARNPAASPVTAWTTMRGLPIEVQVRFRAANCGDYHHRLEATVPLDVTVPANGVERIVLRISEVKTADLRERTDVAPLASLADWESMSVTVQALIEGALRTARVNVQQE